MEGGGSGWSVMGGWRIYVVVIFSFFLASWTLSFFMIFSIPFYVDFGSIRGSILELKSAKNRPRGPCFRRPKLHRAIFRILRDVLDGMQGFEVPRHPENLPKSIPTRKKSHQKFNSFSNDFLNYFFLVFSRFRGPSWDHFCSKIAQMAVQEAPIKVQ